MNRNAKVQHGSCMRTKLLNINDRFSNPKYPYKLSIMEYKLEVKTNMLSTIDVVIAIYNGTLDTRFK